MAASITSKMYGGLEVWSTEVRSNVFLFLPDKRAHARRRRSEGNQPRDGLPSSVMRLTGELPNSVEVVKAVEEVKNSFARKKIEIGRDQSWFVIRV